MSKYSYKIVLGDPDYRRALNYHPPFEYLILPTTIEIEGHVFILSAAAMGDHLELRFIGPSVFIIASNQLKKTISLTTISLDDLSIMETPVFDRSALSQPGHLLFGILEKTLAQQLYLLCDFLPQGW